MAYAALQESLKEIFNSGEYSDLTITCGNDRHRVHRAIVCPRSPFFAKAVGDNAQWLEAKSGIVDLPEDDPQIVGLMVHYFYHLDYPNLSLFGPPDPIEDDEVSSQDGPSPKNGESGVDEALPPPEAPVAEPPIDESPKSDEPPADELAAEGSLWFATSTSRSKDKKKKGKKSAARIAKPVPKPAPVTRCDWWQHPVTYPEPAPEEPAPEEPAARLDWGQVQEDFLDNKLLDPPNLILHVKVYVLADKYGIPTLKDLALKKFTDELDEHWSSEDFLQAAQEVYASTMDTDRGMRDVIVDTLISSDELHGRHQVQELVKDAPQLAFEIVMRSWGRPI